MYPAMGFLWDSTAATVRDDVAAQQGSGLLQWGGGSGRETSWAQGSAGQTRYRCYFRCSMREDFSISFREEKTDSEKAREEVPLCSADLAGFRHIRGLFSLRLAVQFLLPPP